jgi:hypothetical protein
LFAENRGKASYLAVGFVQVTFSMPAHASLHVATARGRSYEHLREDTSCRSASVKVRSIRYSGSAMALTHSCSRIQRRTISELGHQRHFRRVCKDEGKPTWKSKSLTL